MLVSQKKHLSVFVIKNMAKMVLFWALLKSLENSLGKSFWPHYVNKLKPNF